MYNFFKTHLFWLNVPMLAVLLYLMRLLALGTSNFAECFTFFSLISLYGLQMYFEHNKKAEVSDDLKKEMEQVKNALNVLKLSMGKSGERTPFKF